jgi:hypothetical protein
MPVKPEGILRVETPHDLAVAIAHGERCGAIGQPYLLWQLAARRICLLPVLPDASATTVKAFMRAAAGRPSIILFGDDDYRDRGPTAWRQAGRVARWAKVAIVHAAGAEVGHYEAACVTAENVGRVAFVECSTVTAEAWVDLFQAQPHPPRLILIPPRGGVHPLLLDRRAMQ